MDHQKVEFLPDFQNRNDQKEDTDLPEGQDWKVLIVDDEASVHDITKICLAGFTLFKRKIQFLNAFSDQEARKIIQDHPDTAFIMADVVMEANDSGLRFVRYVRETLNNTTVQIAIRTGQAGRVRENEVVSGYRINSYFTKTELTAHKLMSLVTTSLRAYDLAHRLDLELTRRKQAEKDLLDLNKSLEKKVVERTRELHRANRLKSQFLANMSHEIRTSMNGIMGTAALLNEEPLTGRQQEYAHIIHSSAASLLTIINDILDLSKIEAGQLQFETWDFNLRSIVRDVSFMFAQMAREKNIQLTTHVNTNVPDILAGDETRIKQILINLVANAVKFTARGSVNIACSLGTQEKDHVFLTLQVEDTGPGIDPAFKQHLFDKFSQEDVSYGRKYGGTGLGLSITKELTRMMDGKIDVWNRPEGGSVFRVVLKVCRSTACSRKPEEERNKLTQSLAELRAEKPIRILLADDNPVNQRVFSLMLEKLNLKADIVDNGLKVLEKLRHTPYDLIFMDVQMPQLDGLETTRIIRDLDSDVPHKKIPIIALTAHAMEENIKACQSAGMDQFLSKPVHPDKIALAIIKALAGSHG